MSNTDDTPIEKDALTLLKEKATALNITFHPTIGIDALQNKIDSALEDEINSPPPDVTEEVIQPTPRIETASEKRMRQKLAANKLHRVIVTCMNPAKTDWEGEIFTAGSSSIATVKRFIAFNNEAGWHVPQILLNVIKNRKCQIFYNKKNDRGNVTRHGKLIPEFTIVYLPMLTDKELQELAASQAARGAID